MALIVYQIGSKKMENGAASALYFFHIAPLPLMKHANTAMPFPMLSLDRRQIASDDVSGILLQTA